MRKVLGIVASLCVALGLAVMIVGALYDWVFRPSYAGTIIAWVVGFWLLIVFGGMLLAHLYDVAIEREDDRQSRVLRDSAPSQADELLRAPTTKLAAIERRLQQEQREKEEAERQEASRETSAD